MNVYDSRRIVQALAPLGYAETDVAARADLVLINTCSVRDKPEQKVIGTVSRLKQLKVARPEVLLGVCGCVAQQHGKALLDRIPYLDLVFGPDAIGDLPAILAEAEAGRRRASTDRMQRDAYEFPPIDPAFEPGPTAFLTIMKGCDKVCSYCIVPFVRGREVSKPFERVLDEVRALVAGGVREITLLGQNVNSYGKDLPDGRRFPQLLAAIDAVQGLERVRFVTSHPADADEGMLTAFGRLRTVCEALHLPVQSGSDRVLERMRRGYTAAEYLDKVAILRSACPDIALSTDFIVGFPGETREAFEATLQLVRTVRFDSIFSFKYSPRPHTAALRMADDVPDAEKTARLAELQAMQDAITAERMARFLGRTEELLVEGPSRDARSRGKGVEWMGRTRTGYVTNFTAARGVPRKGDRVRVRIDEVLPHCLRGTAIEPGAEDGGRS
jgi:tRNA-2-methylthio-N6-dimethylallyladenosine synthase